MTLIDSSRVAEIAQKFALLMPTMDERQTRLWLAAEAKALQSVWAFVSSSRWQAGAAGAARGSNESAAQPPDARS